MECPEKQGDESLQIRDDRAVIRKSAAVVLIPPESVLKPFEE